MKLCLLALLLFTPQALACSQDEHSHEVSKEEVERVKNRLQHATSPYLLQHQYNPVDWYEWGPEALERAKAENKPIFLSVGYSACHWCHVMEHESFENADIAKLMNESFINIKVDREERPDIDRVYMAAAQAIMRGGGGWPLSVWMTPDLEPFYAGTYYPPVEKFGRPGFTEIIQHVNQLWTTNHDAVLRYGKSMVEHLNKLGEKVASESIPDDSVWQSVQRIADQRFDKEYGGFAQAPNFAPKFPRCTELTVFLRRSAKPGNEAMREIVFKTLDEMAQGGIYDQIGGGFARYSVDRFWTVPHFEKMLYDNSQLAQVYMEAWQASGNEFYRKIAIEILDYVAREMTSPEGGFYSTTDADSEGHEGKFFVWTLEEIREVCGDDADVAIAWYGATQRGNFEGKNILTGRTTLEAVAKQTKKSVEEVTAAIERSRKALYAKRETRVHPHLDDKVLSSWNGMMLSAFARASVVFDRPDYLAVARGNANFLLTKMRREDGRLYRTRREGESKLDGFLEDYAMVGAGLIDLFEADGNRRWLESSLGLQRYAESNFVDEAGAYFSVELDDQSLPVRMVNAQESSLPSDAAVAATNAARLGLLTGDTALLDRAYSLLKRYKSDLEGYPNAFGQMMILLDFLTSNPSEVYVVGEMGDALVASYVDELREAWPPYRVFTVMPDAADETFEKLVPAAKGKTKQDGKPTVYVCHQGVCKAPTVLEADEE